jgi:HAD superfamily hydrolase (TIGR01490 family)
MEQVIFVDFDRTLIRHDSAALCAWPAARLGLVPWTHVLRLIGVALLYVFRLCSRATVQATALGCYKAHARERLRGLIEVLVDRHIVADYSPAVVADLVAGQRAGARIVLLSAAADMFVEVVSQRLGFDGAVGTRLVFDARGTCTGEVDGEIMEGHAKYVAASEYAQKLGATLERCAFYSDHIADLPLLERVGRAVVVSPRRRLRRIAERNGWQVIEHR